MLSASARTMKEKANGLISRGDVRFTIFLFGAMIPLVIWGTKLQAQVNALDEEIYDMSEEFKFIKQELVIIRESQIRLEERFGLTN